MKTTFGALQDTQLFIEGKDKDGKYFVYQKISKSTAKVVTVVGYPQRHIGGIHKFGVNRAVWIQ